MELGQLCELLKDLQPYFTAVHLREKHRSAREIYDAVHLLLKNGIPPSKIIINDRVDVSIAAGSGGVQLAFHSLRASVVKNHFSELKIGCSIHNIEEGQQAYQDGADFLLYGHIFSTNSKPGLKPKGLEELKEMTKQLPIPVIAIGGITPKNAKLAVEAGAKGIAVMSGVLEANDPLSAIKAYQNALKMEV
ncbi:thiamine phosphate synthase [Bacillus sp. BRMEA1]|nr:thiamine phosphate synthase [Neobacillus endophyticus]NRD80681.1 thiamine phosphate synthase [Neobacillus endophyticus]